MLCENLPEISGGHDMPHVLARALGYVNFANECLGTNIKPGASILDFGCGSGIAVKAFCDLGYDAWGVDIDEIWRSDCTCEKANYESPPEIIPRLRVADTSPYRIPYPDRTFDFVFSEQTLEHVFDYAAIFREIIRVMKPGALSVHRFPGPLSPMEGHINVPVPALCYSRLWLSIWALAGNRVIWKKRQIGFSWRQTVEDNIHLMSYNNYPSKKMLRKYAAAAGCDASFLEREEILWRGGGRLKNIPFQKFLIHLLSPALQRYMVITVGKVARPTS